MVNDLLSESNRPQSIIDVKCLCDWATKISGNQCTKFQHLRDGVIYVRLFAKVFPAVVDLDVVDWAPTVHSPEDVEKNYKVIEQAMEELDIPLVPLDRQALKSCEFTTSYHMLVMLFFLYNLTQSANFCFDFEHVVSDELSEFLQSPASVQALARGNNREIHHQLPEVGALVEAAGMIGNTALNGVQGRMLGPSSDGTRALIDFPPPHGAMLVLPNNLKTVAPPKELPPAGSTVRAVGIPGDLNNQVGIVGAPFTAEDGVRVVVEFQPPHGTMLVRPGNLVVVDLQESLAQHQEKSYQQNQDDQSSKLQQKQEDDGQQERQAHQLQTLTKPTPNQDTLASHLAIGAVAEIRETPTLQGVAGKSVGKHKTSGGPVLVVDGSKPQLVNPDKVVLCNQAQEAHVTRTSSCGTPTEIPSQLEFDKLRIKALKNRQDIELLQRENISKDDRVKYLETCLTKAKVPFSPTGAPGVHPREEVEVLWKDGRSKVRGEALVTQLRFENESLQRQLQLAREEKQYTVSTSDESIFKLKQVLENEKAMLTDQHKSELNLAEVRFRSEVTQLQSYFSAELKRISSQVKYEEDMLRQGPPGSTEALEEELLQLRQQKTSQDPLLQAMEQTNTSLKDLALKYETRANQQQQQVEEAYAHCRALMLSLLSVGGEESKRCEGPEAPGWTPILPLLHGHSLRPEADQALKEALKQRITDGAQPVALVNDLLALALRIRQLSGELEQTKREREAQMESLKLQLSKYENSGYTLQDEYEKDEEEAKLREQVARLRKNLEYYREKERILSNGASDTSTALPLAFPASGDPTSEAAVESVCSQVLSMLENKDIESLRKCFWVVVAHSQALQVKLQRTEESLQESYRKQDSIASEVAEQRVMFERQLTEFKANQKMALEEATLAVARDKATVQVELTLTREELEQIRISLREVSQQQLNSASLTLQSDDVRFTNLYRKSKVSQAAIARCRQRENLLVQLVQKQRELLGIYQVLQTVSQDQVLSLHQQKQKIELEDNGLVQQLQQLPPLDDATRLEGPDQATDEVETLVAEAISATREQIAASQQALMSALEAAEEASARATKAEVEMQSLQLALGNQQHLRVQLKEECDALFEEKAELLQLLHEREVGEAAEVEELKRKLRQADTHDLVKVFGEIRQLLAPPDRKPNACPQNATSHHKQKRGIEAAERPTGDRTGAPTPSPPKEEPPVPILRACSDRSREMDRLVSTTPRLAELSVDGYNSALAAALPISKAETRDGTHGLHGKINEARKQIEEILTSTKGVDVQMAQMKSAKLPVPALLPSTGRGTVLDDAEFAKQQQRLIEGFRRTGSGGNPTSEIKAPPMWPDGQTIG